MILFSWQDHFLWSLMTRFTWWWPMFPPSRTPAKQGSLLCKSEPIYIVSFYLFSRHNSLINWGLGLKCLHTSIFIETQSLEGLPTKAKEILHPNEIEKKKDKTICCSTQYFLVPGNLLLLPYYYYYYYYYYHYYY